MNESELISLIDTRTDEKPELEIVVIKSHLIIEGFLDRILQTAQVTTTKLGKLELSFYQKVLIANSLCKKSSDDKIWTYILQLNKIRNDIAHDFSSPKRDVLIEKALSLHISMLDEDLIKQTIELSVKDQLKASLYLVVGFLDAFLCDLLRSNDVL